LRCLTEKNNVVTISDMKASRLFTSRAVVCANAIANPGAQCEEPNGY